jgi:hypothetical protein
MNGDHSTGAICKLLPAEIFDGTAKNCDRHVGTQGWQTSLAVTQAKKRSDHETRSIGIGDGAGIHGHLRARAVHRRLRRWKFGHGWRGNERHGDGIFHQWNDIRRNDHRQCDGQPRGRKEQCNEPVREQSAQPVAQRFDANSGGARLDTWQVRHPAGNKRPRTAGLFIRVVTFIM